MRFTDHVQFTPNTIGHSALKLAVPKLWLPTPHPGNPIWRRIHQVFDLEHFLYPAPPIDLGRVEPNISTLQGSRVLRCPIKTPGMDHVLVPAELTALVPLIQHVLETERFINPWFEKFWAHITFECTVVEAGAHQRVPGWHVDGFQGVREPVRQVEHSYLWSDTQAFEVCLQPFFVAHLDRARHNIFHELERQAIEANAIAGLAGHIYLVDPYTVHRSPRMRHSGWRAIARVTFTETELEDPVNTINQSLSSPQQYGPRLDARNRLSSYEGPTPWELYGLRKSASVVQLLSHEAAGAHVGTARRREASCHSCPWSSTGNATRDGY